MRPLLYSKTWRGGSNEYPQSMFLGRNMKKYLNFCLKIFNFPMINFSVYLNRHVFLMPSLYPFMSSGLFYHNSMDKFISNSRVSG